MSKENVLKVYDFWLARQREFWVAFQFSEAAFAVEAEDNQKREVNLGGKVAPVNNEEDSLLLRKNKKGSSGSGKEKSRAETDNDNDEDVDTTSTHTTRSKAAATHSKAATAKV